MKINDSVNNNPGITGAPAREGPRMEPGKGIDFRSQLGRAEEAGYDRKLEELMSKIAQQGEKLGKKVDIRELRMYKRLISEFLDEALGNSRKFTKSSLLDRRGRHKVYALIKKIDVELDLLTQDVLSEEKDNLGILRRLEDIRGLILDILL